MREARHWERYLGYGPMLAAASAGAGLVELQVEWAGSAWGWAGLAVAVSFILALLRAPSRPGGQVELLLWMPGVLLWIIWAGSSLLRDAANLGAHAWGQENVTAWVVAHAVGAVMIARLVPLRIQTVLVAALLIVGCAMGVVMRHDVAAPSGLWLGASVAIIALPLARPVQLLWIAPALLACTFTGSAGPASWCIAAAAIIAVWHAGPVMLGQLIICVDKERDEPPSPDSGLGRLSLMMMTLAAMLAAISPPPKLAVLYAAMAGVTLTAIVGRMAWRLAADERR